MSNNILYVNTGNKNKRIFFKEYRNITKSNIHIKAMTKDKKDKTHYIAAEGMVFKRKSDGWIAGDEIYLGYTYYIDGKKLDEPKLE